MKRFFLPVSLAFALGAGSSYAFLKWLRPGTFEAGNAHAVAVGGNAAAANGTAVGSQAKDKPAETELVGSASSFADLRKAMDDKSPFSANAKVQQMILKLSPAEIQSMVKEAARGENWWDPKGSSIQTLLLQRWTEVDTEGVLAYTTTLNNWQSYRVVDTVFRTGIQQNPELTIASLAKLPEGFAKTRASSAVLESLAEKDPRQALALWDNKTVKGNPGLIGSVFSAWARNDPTAAAAEWTNRSNSPGSQSALMGVMSTWSQTDPAAAFAWSKTLAKPTDRAMALQSCMSQITQKDPQEAIRMLETLTGAERANSLRTVAEAWAEVDPAKAEEWVKSRTNVMERSQMLTQLAQSSRWTNPARSFALAKELPKGPERLRILQSAVEMMSYGDADVAEKMLKEVSGHEHKKIRENLIGDMVWWDTDKALAMLKENQPEDPADQLYNSMASNLGNKDPEKAFTWAKNLTDPASQRKAFPGLFGSWAATDPLKASQAVGGITDPSMRRDSMASIGSAWAQTDHEKALVWAQGLSGDDRAAAMGAVLASAVSFQPKEVSPQIFEALQQLPMDKGVPDSFMEAARSASSAMVAENPQEAAQWAQSLPHANCRDEVVANVAKQWVEQDMLGASQWISDLPQGLGRDKSVGALIPEIAESDPASAFAWANSVQDDGIRSQMLERTFQSWKKADGEAAEAAIKNSEMSEPDKERWLQIVK